MGGFVGAWLVGTGLVVWRQVHASHKPPVPGTLLGVTGMFAALALLADISPAARPAITWAAWGLDLAGVLNLWPKGLGGQVAQAQSNEATATAGGAVAGEGSLGNAQQFIGGNTQVV